jgi:hypothetical protein
MPRKLARRRRVRCFRQKFSAGRLQPETVASSLAETNEVMPNRVAPDSKLRAHRINP